MAISREEVIGKRLPEASTINGMSPAGAQAAQLQESIDVSSVSTHKKGCSTSAAAVEEESSENDTDEPAKIDSVQKNSRCKTQSKIKPKKKSLRLPPPSMQEMESLDARIRKYKKKCKDLKEVIHQLDDLRAAHDLNEGVIDDNDVDYKYLYHAEMQKKVEDESVLDPSALRVSQYNKDYNDMVKLYSKGQDLDILLRPLTKAKCISSKAVAVPKALIATIVRKGEQPMSFYSFALKMCPMAFRPEGARFFSTSGRAIKELKTFRMPSDIVTCFVDVVLKAAAKLDVGLQENEKICKAKDKDGNAVRMSDENLKRQHARKALTNWLAKLKNRSRSVKVKIAPSASAGKAVEVGNRPG